jgi:NADH:ubiquinone oxidoreductase subunit F (NADH-binding)
VTTATTGGTSEDGRDPQRAAAAGLPRLLPDRDAGPQDLTAHLARHGRLPYRDRPSVLIHDIAESGLTGRGGGAFPVHRKLQAVLDAAGRRRRSPVVVANGAESEPASDKDATLLWLAPHLVLDGLQLAAEAVGADRAVLCTPADRRQDVGRRLREAIWERQRTVTDRVPVELAVPPPRFLAGQETALVGHLAGGQAIPAFMPPRLTEQGLGGSPTLVQNVETLAHLALVARRGPRWFRCVGTEAEPGSMLVTVRRPAGPPHICEVPLGIALAELLGDLPPGGAVLFGGYHGTWITAAQAQVLTLDNRSLAAVGAGVGAGVVIVLPAERCGLIETANAVRYLALESAGQCGPCLNGLPRIAAALAQIAAGRARPQVRADLERWCGLVTGRGACHHPDGAARFVRSALVAFAAEADRHQRGKCSAASAQAFLPIPKNTARTEADWS